MAADPLGRRGDVPLGGIRHPLSPRFSWPVASIAHPAAAGTACAMRVFTVALSCCPSARVRSTAGCAEEDVRRSEEHTSELQSLMRISNAVLCVQKKKKKDIIT